VKFFSKVIFQFLFFLSSANSAELKLVSIDTVPWAYFDAEVGVYAGIFPDIVRELEKESGHKIKISLTPYARINRELESGRQDCTMLIAEKEREKVADLGELVFYMPMGIIAIKNSRLDSYDDLYKLKISVLRSLNITDQFTEDNDLKKEFDTGYEMGLRKVLHGRLNAIAGAIPTIKYLAKEKGMAEMLGEPMILSLKPIYLQCSKESKHSVFIKDINLSLKKIRENGVLNDVVSKYWDLSL
jgi:polar amino acid transport system substrate-binding protein